MTSICAQLTTPDGSYEEDVLLTIPDNDWKRLTGFLAEAERLRETTFVQQGMGGSISVTLSMSQGVSSKAKSMDSDATGQMLMRLRPFILKNEDLYFYKIKNLLARYADHPVFRKQLDIIKEVFELERIQFSKLFSPLGKPFTDINSIMDWLNAYEYHSDAQKRQKVDEKLGVFGKDQDGKPVALFAIAEIVQAILYLSDFVETLVECAGGNSAIKFPESWVNELSLA